MRQQREQRQRQKPRDAERKRMRGRRGQVQRDLIPLRAIEHGTLFVAAQGRAGHGQYPATGRAPERAIAVIEVVGTNFPLRSPDDQASLVASYQALLKALPPDQPLQLLLRSQPTSLDGYLARLQAVAEDPTTHAQLRGVAAAHATHVQQIAASRTLLSHRCYLIVPVDAAYGSAFAPIDAPLSGFLTRRAKRAQARRDTLREQVQVRVERLLAHLSGMNLLAHRLGDAELAQLAASCLSLAPLDTVRLPPDMVGERKASLIDVIAPAAVEERPEYLSVDGRYARGIAVTGYPREVAVGWLAPLIDYSAPLDIILHLHPRDPALVVRRYRRRKAELQASQAVRIRQGQTENPDEQVEAGDVGQMLMQLASRSERLPDVGLYVLVHADDRATLDERTARLRAVLASMLLVGHPTTFEQRLAWQTAQPFCLDMLRRFTPLDTKTLAYGFPFIESGLSMPGGIFEGVTENGEPVLIDDWADEFDNPHRFIGAVTGAGKSYQCKLKMLRELAVRHAEGIQIAVIDPEQEYERLCQELGGTFVRVAPGARQHLNPFDLVPPGIEPLHYLTDRTRGDRLAEKVQSLHALYDLMLSDRSPSGVTTLSVREKGLLDRATYEVYRQAGITSDPATHLYPAPLLGDLYRVLERGAAGRDEYGLGDRLFRYVEGSLAGTFAAPTNVALDASYVVFDVRDMAGELRPLGIFLIADFMWTQVFASLRPRVLYIDEAWSLIQHPEGGRFLADFARRARKRYLRLETITQSPELFIADPHGKVIVGNAATKILKKQDRTSAWEVASSFGLTAAERQRMLTLQKNEALVMTGGKRLVMTTLANPLEHRLATTNPREVAALREQGMAREQEPSTGETQPLPLPSPLPPHRLDRRALFSSAPEGDDTSATTTTNHVYPISH
jgi:conjugal transfer ATP-binding protein TraC